jgi:NADH pyrophosphatase NudC (nudix superfamily)
MALKDQAQNDLHDLHQDGYTTTRICNECQINTIPTRLKWKKVCSDCYLFHYS